MALSLSPLVVVSQTLTKQLLLELGTSSTMEGPENQETLLQYLLRQLCRNA